METMNIPAGKWIITEGGLPAYSAYKVLKGSVSVYRHGEKVNEISIGEGDKPVFLGIIASLRQDRLNTASVFTETELEAEEISIDQLWGILNNELPSEIKDAVLQMINAISLKNDIDSMTRRLKALPSVQLSVPSELREEGKVVLQEIEKLYANLID